MNSKENRRRQKKTKRDTDVEGTEVDGLLTDGRGVHGGDEVVEINHGGRHLVGVGEFSGPVLLIVTERSFACLTRHSIQTCTFRKSEVDRPEHATAKNVNPGTISAQAREN